ncbi:putative NT domain of poly(A) polymerase and terminal uridylyl transferase-containing protein [Hibiscus syriacus]|uniref:NT domain of poly(A) polymerase and terminal uridylyl transferase-containing protein n=1 Tax=Hibiscus syriacus TaxID=106335 RepID=A0A6A3BTL5_HIBSY|nr:putative NT domain of poly(A) polymerase and terminal uridylyl transferase-containing protein [Hibiscus syriacus]
MTTLLLIISVLLWLPSISVAYRPGDIVPMSKMGQYHSSRTVWHDVIGKHCSIFAVNREVLIPIAKPTGYTGADPYKISFQVGKEKFLVPWLLLINRKSSEVPMIDMHLRYSGGDLHGVTAKIVDMPHHYVEIHPNIRKQFWDPQHWPKHVLVRYTWEEQSEIDVTSGFYVLFGSGKNFTLYKLVDLFLNMPLFVLANKYDFLMLSYMLLDSQILRREFDTTRLPLLLVKVFTNQMCLT